MSSTYDEPSIYLRIMCSVLEVTQAERSWSSSIFHFPLPLFNAFIIWWTLYLLTNHILSASGNAGLERAWSSSIFHFPNSLVAHILCWSLYLLLSIYSACIDSPIMSSVLAVTQADRSGGSVLELRIIMHRDISSCTQNIDIFQGSYNDWPVLK